MLGDNLVVQLVLQGQLLQAMVPRLVMLVLQDLMHRQDRQVASLAPQVNMQVVAMQHPVLIVLREHTPALQDRLIVKIAQVGRILHLELLHV
jgi:hypothetical protein